MNTDSNENAQLAAIQGGMGEAVGFDRNAAYAACPESGCDWGSFYVGWKAAAAQHQRITAAMAAEVERFAQANRELSEKNVRRREQVRQLRAELAELAEVKGREAVSDADIEAAFARAGGRWDGDKWVIEDADLHPFARSISTPPASPDVEGLVKALERFTSNSAAQANMPCECEEAEAALSTWRQAHTPSTLPASSAEE